MGSGTTAIAVEQAGVEWIGIERSMEYVKMANNRLAELRAGSIAVGVVPLGGRSQGAHGGDETTTLIDSSSMRRMVRLFGIEDARGRLRNHGAKFRVSYDDLRRLYHQRHQIA